MNRKVIKMIFLHFSKPCVVSLYSLFNLQESNLRSTTLIIFPLPGQPCPLQDWVMELFPKHGEPLLAGTGLVQVRMRVCDPPPHVTSQALQVPQVDQPPSTKQSRNCNKK